MFYIMLNKSSTNHFKTCAMKRFRDLHKLEDDISWNDIWNNGKNILHSITVIYKTGKRDDSKCIKRGPAEGTLLHLLWDCSKILQ